MQDYLKAKKDLKRDFIILVAMIILIAIIASILMGVFVFSKYNSTELFESMTSGDKISVVAMEVLIPLLIGAVLGCAIPGWILSFRFMWRKVGGLSVLLAIIVYAIGAAYGWLITLIYFIVGLNKVRRLGKALGIQK